MVLAKDRGRGRGVLQRGGRTGAWEDRLNEQWSSLRENGIPVLWDAHVKDGALLP